MTRCEKRGTKTLWVKGQYLREILAGRKTVEVRVGYSNILRLQPGDTLLLNEQFPFYIDRIGLYTDFEELLDQEDPQAIAPGCPRDELLTALRAIYPPEKEALGAVALAIRRSNG